MAKTPVIKFTANFRRNLENVERALSEADGPAAYDHLLDELLETVIPNLERFPDMGRSLLARRPGSVETSNASAALSAELLALTPARNALREYVLKDYLLLYVLADDAVYLLAIRHQRHISFDFKRHWGY